MSTNDDCLNIGDRDPNRLNNLFDSLNSSAKDKYYYSCPDYIVHDGNSNYVTAEDVYSSIEYNRTNCFGSFCVNVRSLANTTNFENCKVYCN